MKWYTVTCRQPVNIQVTEEVIQKIWSHPDDAVLRGANKAVSNPGRWFVVSYSQPSAKAKKLEREMKSLGLKCLLHEVDEQERNHRMHPGGRRPEPNSSDDLVEEEREELFIAKTFKGKVGIALFTVGMIAAFVFMIYGLVMAGFLPRFWP